MQKKNDFDIKRRNALRWGYAFSGIAGILMLVFFFRIIFLQNTDVKEIQENYIAKNFRTDTLKAARGNLYASDGSVLATTIIRYKVYVDFQVIKDTVYSKNINALSDSLAQMFHKPKTYFRKKLDREKQKGNRYFFLAGQLDYDQMTRLKNFPIFNLGKSKGGFILDKKNDKREIATSKIGIGTIGVDKNGYKSGFEGAFSKYLSGSYGTQLEQRINAKQWKPIDYWNAKEPVDGEDVYVTLDLRVQDIAHTALMKQLKKFNAHHGSVIVMEVATGKIKAMVNLRKTENGDYKDVYNYALKDAIEPGSIFKPVSLLAAMDDGFIDENTTVYNSHNIWKYGELSLKPHAYGNVGIVDILAKSCNVGTSKLITKHYKNKPQVFIDHLKKWKMDRKMELEVPGVTKPYMVTPDNPKWSKGALASLSYGYSSRFNLLQLATFYNGVANGGKMLKPLFIEKIMKDGETIYTAKPEVMVESMASKEVISTLVDALTKAVEKGTARSIFTPNLKMAGKTGTARLNIGKKVQRNTKRHLQGFIRLINRFIRVSFPLTIQMLISVILALRFRLLCLRKLQGKPS